jgi:hypothetical protein
VKKLFTIFIDSVKKYANMITIIIVFINVLIGAWTVLNGDINFKSDIARDFLLFQEISQKGIILIGPRASGLPGLFHGPLWIYLNYPAYILGHGDPIVVGYFWIALIIAFLGISYFAAKKLFNKTVANIYVILLSSATIYYANNLFNPFGAMLVMPIFIYTIVRYSQTLKWKYLAFNFLSLGCIIQFQLADGLPFLILTTIYVLYLIIRHKKYFHLFNFALFALPFSTFFLFDIRHGFEQTHAIINSFSSHSTIPATPYVDRINNRWDSMTKNIYFADGNYSGLINGMISFILLIFLYTRFFKNNNKTDHNNKTYALVLYFYIGFYVISVFFNGILLYHYTFPLIPLLFLVFSSMIIYINKKIFVPLLVILVLYNFSSGINFVQSFVKDKGVAPTSWNFQLSIAQKIFHSNDKEFGYFIYTPDFYGYGPKYAYAFAKTQNPDKTVYLFEKKPITYVVIEPAPATRPELTSDYWKNSLVKITSSPVNTDTFPNGFKIQKYKLTQTEIDTPPDPQATDWLHFR